MMLTAHFSLGEFFCRDGSCPPDEHLPNVKELAEQLEILRRAIKKPIVIVSGYRTPAWNAKVKGAGASQHMLGKAADIRVAGMYSSEVHAAIESQILRGRMKNGGLGLYSTWVHYDVRNKPARWRG